MKMASSTEELDLLERVFLRIGAAESDEQLESAINKFLIPVLLKLSSPNEGVRKKVMELLVHVNKRVKRRPTVQLPVEALLTHYRDPKASSFLINFSILYIKIGYPRLPQAKQEELAPSLLLACEGKPKIHQDGLLLLLMSVIGSIKVPADAQKKKEMFMLDEKPELMKQLSSFMLDVLLLPYAFISSVDEEAPSGSGQPAPQAPPGMSEYGMKRVTSGEVPMTPERLEQTKLGIVKFLATGVLSDDEIICHLIIAAADTRFTVANLADTELKRVAGSVNWSNVAIANKLFHIYLGSPEVPADKRHLIPQANRISPANTRIRLKILPYLSRLEKEAILFPGSIQVIFNSLYDANTNPKLKLQALNFALAIVRRSDIQAMNKMGGMLYTGLLKLVWNTEETEQLRVVGYTIIGQIVKRLPHIINTNLIELQVFFENLSCDQTEIKNAVRDSLLTMVDAFKMFMEDEREKIDVDVEPKNDGKDALPNRELIMMALLSSQIEAKEPTARFVAVKYTAAVFRSDHIQSRYLLLLSAGDSNSDVSSVAIKSLYSSFESKEGEEIEAKKILLPEFSEIIQCVFEKATARMKNPNQMVTVQNTNLPFNVATFLEILTYLRLCLAKSSKVNINSKELISHPCDSSPLIGRYISEVHKSNPSVFDNYLSLIEMVLPVSSSIIPLSCLVEVFGTCPELFASRYSEKLPWIMNFLNNTKEEIREIAASLLSIVCTATMDDSKLDNTLQELLKMMDNKSLETQHGVILSLGHIIERKITGYGGENWAFPREIIAELVKHLDSSNAFLTSPACIALGLIAKSTALPLPNESDDGLSKHGILNKFIEIIKNVKLSYKIKERAIQSCGLLCLGENFPFAKELVDKFLEISKETKDTTIHFSIGESIVLCIEGISSPQKRNLWRIEKTEYKAPPIPAENLKLLSDLLDTLLSSAKQLHPSVRQSVCVYLLFIVKRLSSLSTVKEKLFFIQSTFMDLLSENNELVQDMASKGLALVYENTTEENKKELVSGLLDQLLTGKREVQKVTSDTKIFEEGQLGNAPTGGGLSTYKEICGLASDLNQPDLVYKFMHLANHNAIWNSKKGAAFGFQTIATEANDQLNEYLPKIVPRLYRYQFDPTPKIQQSMANIWRSLVKDTQKTIDKYYNEILDDLLYNLTSNQWRVRHSCCLALQDFFRGNRSIVDAKSKLPELWKSLFRVMDDIHEGTRIVAQNTSKVLSKLCVRVCSNELGKVNQEMLEVVLSVFLSGIANPAAEVRSLSLQTVSQLVNSAGPSLKPNLTTLIPSLLEAAGELESVGLSYLSAQYGGQSQTQEVIDSVRANVAKSHYTTQAVAKCVQYVELDMLSALVPRITEIMKSVNLGSRVACAHLIILLCSHLGRSMEQYTGKFLSSLVNGLLDRNATVRKTYASTIGKIVHTAKPSSMERLVTKLSNWYFEKEDLNTRTAIGLTLQAIAQNGEILKEQFPIVIPLIFFAMHSQKIEGEDNSHVVMWEEIWNEVTPSSEAGIKQHMNEICKVVENALTSPSWTMKAQGARCVATIAIKIGDSLESTHRDQIIKIMLEAMKGKTFPGKEDLLRGLSKLSTNCSDKLKESPEKCQEIVDALLRECNKSELGYKRHGLEALGITLEAFDNIDCFKQVYDIVKDLLKKLDEDMEEGETSEELTKRRNEKYKTIEVVYETLGKSWPRNKATQLEYQDLLLNECYRALERSPRDIQVAILTALRCYLEKLHYFNEEYSTTTEESKNIKDILDKTTQALHFSLGVAKHTRLRKEALNIIFTLGNKLNSAGRSEELQAFTNALRSRLQELEKDPTPEVRTRLMDLKEMFKN